MTEEITRGPVLPGDRAPNFVLPAVSREGTVALESYRGRGPALVAFFRGLHCPFCRRHITQLGAVDEQLRTKGVETIGIVNAEPERARLYLRYRPTGATLAADPVSATHRAFGLPILHGNFPADFPLSVKFRGVFHLMDGFKATEADKRVAETNPSMLVGQFLVDGAGIVREAFLEAKTGMSDFGKFPSVADFIAAAAKIAA